jgi:predicted  nucleic acid-binding Zn-ribbon protein
VDFTPLIPIVAIAAFTVLRLAKLRASHPEALPGASAARLAALEHDVQALQQELAETQERLDFAERLLSTARDEGRIGGHRSDT